MKIHYTPEYRCLRNKRPSKPYGSKGSGAMAATKPSKLIWSADIHGPKPCEFIGFRWALISQTPMILPLEAGPLRGKFPTRPKVPTDCTQVAQDLAALRAKIKIKNVLPPDPDRNLPTTPDSLRTETVRTLSRDPPGQGGQEQK